MKLQLQFKEKQLCYCGQFMQNVVAREYFYLLADVRAILKAGSYLPDDIVTINVEGADIIKIYRHLGTLSEVTSSAMNEEIKYALLPQLVALQSSEDAEIAAEATAVYSQIAELFGAAQAALLSTIESGRAWLLQ